MELKWLIRHSRPQIPFLIVVTVLNGLYALLCVVFALICRGIIDSAVEHDTTMLVWYSAGMLMVVTGNLIMQIGGGSMMERIRAHLEIMYRNYILQVLTGKEYSSVSRFHSGEIMNRMFNDINVVCDGITSILPGFVLMMTKGICAVAVLFILCPQFAAVLLTGGILLVIITAVLRNRLKMLHRIVQERSGRVRSFLQEMMESILIIKVFAVEQKMLGRASDVQEDYYKAYMKRRNISITAGAGVSFAFELAYFFALLVGANGIMAGTMTYGTMMAVLQLVGQIRQPFTNLSSLIPQYYSMLASAERLMELEKLENEGEYEDIDIMAAYSNMSAVCGEHVTFSYGRMPVLNDMSFTVNKGDMIAVTGLSGGGKSTMFMLFLGAYRLEKGSLYIRTVSGERIKLGKETRRMFAYVPQRNCLFSGTIRENITFLSGDVADDRIEEILHMSCADIFVNDLPEGIDTVIGEQGHGLSEGQGQRIAIARALLSDSPILLLDEATSALDEDTELRVLINIASLKDKTCFIVTHRKAAMQFCNKHMDIEKGSFEET